MSGKSTLLRALGVNALLAQAGAPVCAAALSMPELAVATSILVEDSLREGVSFFMAELLRIRQIVEAARQAQRRGGRLLYLLDEVLRGTNSAERRAAVREIVGFLLEAGAIGALSTHDLALAGAPELEGAARSVHFRETVHPNAAPGEPPMSFDFQLRPGVSPGGNALALLRLVGLDRHPGETPEAADCKSPEEEMP